MTFFSCSSENVVSLLRTALFATRKASFSLRISIATVSSSTFAWRISIWLLILLTSGESSRF